MKKIYLYLSYYIDAFFTAPCGFATFRFIVLALCIVAFNASLPIESNYPIVPRLVLYFIFAIFISVVFSLMFALIKAILLNDSLSNFCLIALFIICFPLFLVALITIVENKTNFPLSSLSMNEWPTVFAGILTYYGTTILGLLTLYPKSKPVIPLSFPAKSPHMLALPCIVLQKVKLEDNDIINQSCFIKEFCAILVTQTQSNSYEYLRLKINFTNDSQINIYNISVASLCCNLYFNPQPLIANNLTYCLEKQSVASQQTVCLNVYLKLPHGIFLNPLQAVDINLRLGYTDASQQTNCQFFKIKTNICHLPLNHLRAIKCISMGQ